MLAEVVVDRLNGMILVVIGEGEALSACPDDMFLVAVGGGEGITGAEIFISVDEVLEVVVGGGSRGRCSALV